MTPNLAGVSSGLTPVPRWPVIPLEVVVATMIAVSVFHMRRARPVRRAELPEDEETYA